MLHAENANQNIILDKKQAQIGIMPMVDFGVLALAVVFRDAEPPLGARSPVLALDFGAFPFQPPDEPFFRRAGRLLG